MSPTARVVAALALVQAVLVAVYLVVEASRGSSAPFLSESIDRVAPAVAFERRDGLVAGDGRRTVVHFWATWCAPCRTELPALLAAADAEGVRLVAATDEPWTVVERYFHGDVPQSIVRDPGGAGRAAYEVSGLPDTFIVADDRVVGRVSGPRDWSSPAARQFLGGVP